MRSFFQSTHHISKARCSLQLSHHAMQSTDTTYKTIMDFFFSIWKKLFKTRRYELIYTVCTSDVHNTNPFVVKLWDPSFSPFADLI